MADSKKTKASSDANPNEASVESLEKVRELLFGSQLGAVESKIQSTEQSFSSELKNLNAQTQSNIDSLERYTKDELDSLAEQIALERSRREDMGDDLSNEQERATKNIEKQLSSLQDQLADTAKTLRQQSHESVKELKEYMQDRLDHLTELLKTTDQRLSQERVHRDTLAGLFRDVAAHLDSSSPTDTESIVEAVNDIETK